MNISCRTNFFVYFICSNVELLFSRNSQLTASDEKFVFCQYSRVIEGINPGSGESKNYVSVLRCKHQEVEAVESKSSRRILSLRSRKCSAGSREREPEELDISGGRGWTKVFIGQRTRIFQGSFLSQTSSWISVFQEAALQGLYVHVYRKRKKIFSSMYSPYLIR